MEKLAYVVEYADCGVAVVYESFDKAKLALIKRYVMQNADCLCDTNEGMVALLQTALDEGWIDEFGWIYEVPLIA